VFLHRGRLAFSRTDAAIILLPFLLFPEIMYGPLYFWDTLEVCLGPFRVIQDHNSRGGIARIRFRAVEIGADSLLAAVLPRISVNRAPGLVLRCSVRSPEHLGFLHSCPPDSGQETLPGSLCPGRYRGTLVGQGTNSRCSVISWRFRYVGENGVGRRTGRRGCAQHLRGATTDGVGARGHLSSVLLSESSDSQHAILFKQWDGIH
jgi:hypothetical protein